jgi:hypothetical protein
VVQKAGRKAGTADTAAEESERFLSPLLRYRPDYWRSNEGVAIEYNEKMLDHFFNPRNVGVMEDADGIGRLGDAACGDVLWRNSAAL